MEKRQSSRLAFKPLFHEGVRRLMWHALHSKRFQPLVRIIHCSLNFKVKHLIEFISD